MKRDATLLMSHVRTTLVGELPVLAFIAGVILVFAIFRLMLSIVVSSYEGPIGLGTYLSSVSRDFILTLGVGVFMWALVQPVRSFGPADGRRRVIVLAVTVVTATLVAAGAYTGWQILIGGAESASTWRMFHIFCIRYGLLASLIVVVGEFHRREVRSLEAMRAAEADRNALEQQTLQARLKTLEAQIEPHFLFNTLANVRRLYETDADSGEAMLDRLMRYLEVALPSMRSDRSTLDREAELIGAYLDLQRVRMGRRLDFRVDIAAPLRALEVPPMMLLTLVENAIKHGLAPQRHGGRVDVEARLEGGELLLEVADTGHGFGGDTSGGGTGLANIRARLNALFGPAAGLTLVARDPHGVRAEIRMPVPGAAA